MVTDKYTVVQAVVGKRSPKWPLHGLVYVCYMSFVSHSWPTQQLVALLPARPVRSFPEPWAWSLQAVSRTLISSSASQARWDCAGDPLQDKVSYLSIPAWWALPGETSNKASSGHTRPGGAGSPGSSGLVTGTIYVIQAVGICVLHLSLVYWIGVLWAVFLKFRIKIC